MRNESIIACTFMVILFLLLSAGWSRAEDTKGILGLNDAFLQDISSEVFTGYTADGKSIIRSVSVYETDNPQILWGFPLNMAKIELTQLGNMDNGGDSTLILDRATFAGKLGDSDTFYLSVIDIDTPYDAWGAGVIYDPSHWTNKQLNIRVGLYELESSKMLGTFEGKYELADGYWLCGDAELGMESAFNRDYLDGSIYIKHNMKPDGTIWMEFGASNIIMENYFYAGVGVVLF